MTGIPSKPTLKDVAKLAGVGTATVERALNGRGNVRPQTLQKIAIAARQLHYGRLLPLERHGIIRINVILVRPETLFFSRLNRAFERIAALLDKEIVIQRMFVSENDGPEIARKICSPDSHHSAVILVAPGHSEVKRAMREVAALGLPIIQIVGHTVSELPYVGIDNYAAGRTAALFSLNMTSHKQGTFIAFCHSGAYEHHKQRIKGFSDYFEEFGNRKQCFREVMFDQDDEQQGQHLITRALSTYSDLAGIYTAGGDSRAIGVALRKQAARKPFWVGHELSPETELFLRERIMNIVIDQAPEIQARRAIDLVLHKLGIIQIPTSSESTYFNIITPENIFSASKMLG